MRRKYRPLMIQTSTPMLDDVTRRKPGRRHFKQLSGGGRGIPPIPTLIAINRAVTFTPIADYASISEANWSTGTTGGFYGLNTTAYDWNYFYHYYTVPNAKTSTYSKIMQPVRIAIAAPASDGDYYDHWTSTTDGGSLFGFHANYLDEVCPKILPTDSHCSFKDGWCEIKPPTLQTWFTNPAPAGGSSPSLYDPNIPTNIVSLNPTYYTVATSQQIYAMQKRINGVAVGDLIVGPKSSGSDWQVEISKGDTLEVDIWLKLTAVTGVGTGIPGRGMLYRPTSVVATSRTVVHPNGPFAQDNPIFTNGLRVANVNATPNHNWLLQTYRITLNGHTGWTFKDGSNGPHKIQTGNGWTALKSQTRTHWSNSTSKSFRNVFVDWGREIPFIALSSGGSDYVAAGGSSSDVHVYRPQFGASTSYRSQTQFRQVLKASDGTSWQDAGTVDHAPSGVFDQDGTTTFKLVEWGSGGRYLTGYLSPAVFFPAAHIPTTITLTQVDL